MKIGDIILAFDSRDHNNCEWKKATIVNIRKDVPSEHNPNCIYDKLLDIKFVEDGHIIKGYFDYQLKKEIK